jgi:hypothetical protein
MTAPIQKLWRDFPHLLRDRDVAREPPTAADEVPFRFRECEDCGPSADDLRRADDERAEWFKRDQLLPIMGWSTGVPG